MRTYAPSEMTWGTGRCPSVDKENVVEHKQWSEVGISVLCAAHAIGPNRANGHVAQEAT